MKEKGLPDVNAVRNYFESTIQGIAKNHGSDSMFWEEVFDKNYSLLDTSIVDIWLSFDEVAAATAQGKRVVNSYNLYLDQQIPNDQSTFYFWSDTWRDFYAADPTNATVLTPEQEALILGGSISMWGEQVNAFNCHSRIFPRSAGGAERLWSSKDVNDPSAAEGRIDHLSCKLNQRGIGSGPIRPSSQYGYCPTPRSSPFNHMHEIKYNG